MRDELLTQLHALPWGFNPPATNDDIARMAAELGCTLNETLVALYRDHNGVQENWQFFLMRLMSVNEVIETYHRMEEFRAIHPDLMRDDVRWFWSDDNSNHVGMHISGPLAGKLCFYDHEDDDFSPRFRSVASYYAHILRVMETFDSEDEDNRTGWWNMPTDYPLLHDAPETDAADFALALECLAQYNAITRKRCETRVDRHFYGFTAMNLLPFSESARLIPLTVAASDEDMWIQAYACEILGNRRYLPAIRRLTEVARDGRHNGKMAAVVALGQMRTPEAKAALLSVAAYHTDGWRMSWEWAMREVDK